MGQTPRRSLKLPREMSTKSSQRSASAAAVLVHSSGDGKQRNPESTNTRGRVEKLLSEDENSLGGLEITEQHDLREASTGVPSESMAASLTTPEIDCLDHSTFSWEVSPNCSAWLSCSSSCVLYTPQTHPRPGRQRISACCCRLHAFRARALL